jgi:bifunctional non-homologous end joining protein LigD
VGGWTDPSGSRVEFGALLLGYYEDGRLKYCGRVGTGFNSQSLLDIKQELDKFATGEPPFDNPPSRRQSQGVHWVQPKLVAEVEFNSWTDQGLLRQPTFRGLREDKLASEIVRETPRPVEEGRAVSTGSPRRSTKRAGSEVAGVRLTHPDRVLYPGQGITKRELADFYQQIAGWILPHVVERPVTLVRCPKGHGGNCFYQKHLTESMPDQLRGVEIEESSERHIYVVINDLPGLISLVQMSVLELHPWPARVDRLDRPDRLVFDLDPDESVAWKDVIRAAHDVRQRLEESGLRSFIRTSGGKGLHAVVPLSRRTTWEDLKKFAKSIADNLTAEFPDRYIATTSKARRKGKIFIDYLRNQRSATAVASYSTRARPGAPVATPIGWEELDARLTPDRFNVRNLGNRLAKLVADPWDGFFDLKQSIPKLRTRAGSRR